MQPTHLAIQVGGMDILIITLKYSDFENLEWLSSSFKYWTTKIDDKQTNWCQRQPTWRTNICESILASVFLGLNPTLRENTEQLSENQIIFRYVKYRRHRKKRWMKWSGLLKCSVLTPGLLPISPQSCCHLGPSTSSGRVWGEEKDNFRKVESDSHHFKLINFHCLLSLLVICGGKIFWGKYVWRVHKVRFCPIQLCV